METRCGGGYGHVVKTDYMMMMMMAVTPVGLTSSILKIEATGSSEALNITRGYSRSLVTLPYTTLTHWHTQSAVRWAEPSMPLLLILALCQ
jgi:hypothetical protein